MTDEGAVLLQLRHPWADGTTHLVFDPVEFLGRLAVLVPRPRINLLSYYGVLGARAAWRRQVVPRAETAIAPADRRRGDAEEDTRGDRGAWPVVTGRGYLGPS